jgi:serine-type D-Ala-D-Ala carboxypeptidase/endopeptidase
MTARISRRRLALAVAAGAALPAASRAQTASPAGEVLATRLKATGVGLVAVEVTPDQVTLTARGDAGPGKAMGQDAVFEIGSITKTFTALLLADAVVRGKLKLDGAVEDALDGHKLRDKDDQPIRWIDIATHRSGLPRLPGNLKPASPQDPYADYGEVQLREFLAGFKATQARGTSFGYSNLGFGLMGYALGKAAGTDYETLLFERVLKPLGLDRAKLALTGRPAPAALADGHAAERQPVPHWRFGVLAPAGALLMDGATLGRYAQAALGAYAHPLGEAFALCLGLHADGKPPTGLGWLFGKVGGRTVANHDGGTFGFSTSLFLDTEKRRAAAVLSNCAVPVNDLALHLIEPSIPPKTVAPVAPLTEVTLDPAVLKPLEGLYAMAANPQFKIELRIRDGQLWAQATGQDAFQVRPAGSRRFFANVTPPIVIEFDAGEGAPASFRLSQAGGRVEFKREP